MGHKPPLAYGSWVFFFFLQNATGKNTDSGYHWQTLATRVHIGLGAIDDLNMGETDHKVESQSWWHTTRVVLPHSYSLLRFLTRYN